MGLVRGRWGGGNGVDEADEENRWWGWGCGGCEGR